MARGWLCGMAAVVLVTCAPVGEPEHPDQEASGSGELGSSGSEQGLDQQGAAKPGTLPLEGMVRIPAGEFMMGSDDIHHARPVHAVSVASFDMDVTEVTVAQYAACVKARRCSKPAAGGDCNWRKPGKDEHPVNCVDWSQATAYCAWAGKRLPTEEEWEYAARGTDGRQYPWGNSAPGSQLCWSRPEAGTCVVGSYQSGISSFGLLDMAGNVWEWTSSQYCDSYAPTKKCDDHRVLRGGDWERNYPPQFLCAERMRYDPEGQSAYFGIRCARDVS